ncbi:helix-turn-helix domain-containing protein [Jannaschia sp. R86511]|uniref:helix-turn-helix domain-containing protein n=1 Tax=Jannaschia sp. R86511 TaxID=3093853 RepID=UPI0036D35301
MDTPYSRISGKPVSVISTSDALRAVAHPLRMRLIALLRRHGPSTASRLGREVGESSGSTSYHLRQLARYGLVELDPEQPNRRDKLWRATTDSTDVDVRDLAEDPAGRAALGRVVRMQVERFGRHAAAATQLPGDELAVWGPVMGSSDATTRLTPQMLQELRDDLLRVLSTWVDRGDALPEDDPEARRVSVYLGAVPIQDDGTDW